MHFNTFLVKNTSLGKTAVKNIKQPEKLVESREVCSKFRLSPTMVRTYRLAARFLALREQINKNKVYMCIDMC
jgi:hypothetical protein